MQINNMNTYICRIFPFLFLILVSCVKERYDGKKVVEGMPSELNLVVKPMGNDLVTRASSSDYDENKINNLYLFVCDGEGSVVSRKYFSYYQNF